MLVSTIAQSQKLPPTSRTVFKCVEGGKTFYSDAPCLGAEKINVEPTRGMNKSTGREIVGADVNRERTREAVADAIKPLTGMTAKQLDASGRRMRLSSSDQQSCKNLDIEIPRLEAEEKVADQQTKLPIQRQLLGVRQKYRNLGC
jgi:hypothetical protein